MTTVSQVSPGQVAEEQVLVVPTAVFHELGHFQGFSTKVDHYLPALLGCGQLSYRPRGEMEEDPSYKQLIPYVLFRFVDDEGVTQLFNYQRGSGNGEARLRAKRSVGVGGHISTVDADAVAKATGQSGDVYREGLERELAEEVTINASYKESCVGILNDDATEVGKVHLGVVHLFDLQLPDMKSNEADIVDTCFKPLSEIAEALEQYESWSQIAVKALVEQKA